MKQLPIWLILSCLLGLGLASKSANNPWLAASSAVKVGVVGAWLAPAGFPGTGTPGLPVLLALRLLLMLEVASSPPALILLHCWNGSRLFRKFRRCRCLRLYRCLIWSWWLLAQRKWEISCGGKTLLAMTNLEPSAAYPKSEGIDSTLAA